MNTNSGFMGTHGVGYEQATGKVISAIKTANKKTDRVIDGFVKPNSMKQTTPSTAATLRSEHVHRRPQKAQTLMRTGLKKPARAVHTGVKKLSPTNVDRELRAKLIPKHSGIDRYGGSMRPSIKPAAKNMSSPRAMSGELLSGGGQSASAAQTATAPLPSMITSASHQKLERLLDEALVRADAHKEALRYQAARHFWQKRWMSGPRKLVFAVALLLVLAVGILAAWQKVPQVSVKVAGMQAHLSPAVPTYKPDGYVVDGPAKAESGAVSLTYKSATNSGSTFEIKQAQSDLTSTSLAQSFIPKGAAVQTSQVEGNTVYIYGSDNDAAWLNNGILYTIKDNANLSSNELLKIVQGLD